MSDLTFEPVGSDRGLAVFDAVAMDDCAGTVVRSFDTTNTAGTRWAFEVPATPPESLDATMHDFFARYDDLLRRLAE